MTTLLLAMAHAQDVDADTFSVSGGALDHQGTLQAVSPHLGDPGSFYGGLGVVYAHEPLVLQLADGSREVLVDGQLSTRLAVGYNVASILRFDLELPVYPWLAAEGATSFAVGETRLGVVVPFARYEDEGVGFALASAMHVPTATDGAWVSNGGFGGNVVAALGGRTGRLGWDVNAGAELGPAAAAFGTTTGTSLTGATGVWLVASESALLGLEGTGSLDLAGGAGSWNEDPVEAHAYVTVGTGKGLAATLAGGTGLVPGVGAPVFRAALLLGLRNPGVPIVHDSDGDGLYDDVDACVDVAEDLDRFADSDGCPELDNDKDGLVDGSDRCPDEAEDYDTFEDDEGCPDPDNDADGVLDDEDRCPNVAGVVVMRGCPDNDGDGIENANDTCPDEAGTEAMHGCPDRDGDFVPDGRDRCPDVPADPRVDPRRSDGCPARVIVTKNEIKILDKIYFDTNKATIKAVSFELIAEIAKVINDNPDIRLIEIAGHTDDVGKDAANLALSQARAESVMARLLSVGGVDSSRLVARGYGEAKPVDSNDTEAGRALNRRVDFNIMAQ